MPRAPRHTALRYYRDALKGPDDPIADLATQWAARGVDLERLTFDSSGTILPPTVALTIPADLESAKTVAAESTPPGEETDKTTSKAKPKAETQSLVTKLTSMLPLLAEPVGGHGQFAIGATLGEGGMGIVRVAEQTALRRQVAVKSQRTDHDDAATTLQLLREARATGALEHPNIVPVHALGRDERQRPLIVMKRIEGSSWSDLLRQQPASASDDALDMHLEILAQVARALQFAHSRGIVHLDVKPDNVMVGSFGEVYLVDWGIAMRCREGLRRLEDLPLTRDLTHIVGTPNYLAPEMAMADGPSIGEHTDLYLLGATLYEVVSGRVPHEGTSIREILQCAYLSAKKEYPTFVPSSLRAICDRAMARAIDDRFPTAQSFLDALLDLKRHRSSLALSDVATKELIALRERVRIQTGDHAAVRTTRGRGEGIEAERRAISDLFSACRFGFAHALRVWPENEEAVRGRREAYETIVRFELDRGSAATAAAYLVETPDMPDALAEDVKRAMQNERHRRDKLTRLEHDAVFELGDRLRSLVAFVTGFVWGGGHLLFAYLRRVVGTDITAFRILLGHLVIGVVIVISAMAGRRTFFGNAANARTSWFYSVFAGSHTACWAVAAVSNISVDHTLRIAATFSAFVWLLGALVGDRRVWPLSAAFTVAVIGDLIVPTYTFEWVGLAAFLGPVAVGLIWRRDTRIKAPTDALRNASFSGD